MGTAPGMAADTSRHDAPHRDARQRRAAWRVLLLTTALVAGSAAALALAGPAFAGFRDAYSTAVSLPWWVLALAFAAAGVLVFDIEVHREAHTFTFSEVPLVLGLLFAGPASLIVGRLVGETGILTIRERQ